MRKLRVAAGLAVLALTAAVPAAAQVTIGADAYLNSQYIWRGLTFTNKPVIQPDVWVSAYGFTVGAWANIEVAKCDGANDYCESGYGSNLSGGPAVAPRSGIAEIDLWAQYARTTGNVSWTLGWILYTFNKDNGNFTNFYDTNEGYGILSLGGLPVTPTLYASYDLDNVKGLYVQPSVSYGVKASPALTITLGALAGLSFGQGVDTTGKDKSANFFGNGLTHLDFSASTSFTAGPVSFTPNLHFQVSNDMFVRNKNAQEWADLLSSPGSCVPGSTSSCIKGSSTKIFGGVTISWSRALGASAAE